jgi:glycosyltransferase involved in cell wall biosynthesis
VNIGAYFHLSRIGLPNGDGTFRIEPTGVGRHTVDMLLGLAAMPEMRVSALVPREESYPPGRIPPEFPVASLPVIDLPYSRRSLETRWTLLNRPKIDRWYPGGDWIYCPQEAFVASDRARLAVTAHDTWYLEPEHPWRNWGQRTRGRARWKLLYRAIKKHASLILAVSEFTKSRLVNLLGFDPAKIAVVGNAVHDIYFSDPPAGDGPPAPGPYLLVVGGLAEKKGGDFLLAVAGDLMKKRPDLKIVVCGVSDSPYKERAAALSNMVRFGYEPIERHLRLLKGARALLMLSRYEGFGIPAAEAMAAGTPAIVSRFASLPEVVGDEGLAVDARNTAEVIEAIEKVDRDPAFRRSAIAKGRARAENFRREAMVARLVNALRKSS